MAVFDTTVHKKTRILRVLELLIFYVQMYLNRVLDDKKEYQNPVF